MGVDERYITYIVKKQLWCRNHLKLDCESGRRHKDLKFKMPSRTNNIHL